jgi:hypothetical protein
MTTTDDTKTLPTFGPDPAWCTADNAGHAPDADTGVDDEVHIADGLWKRAHDGGDTGPIDVIDGYIVVSWGANEVADGGPMEFSITVDWDTEEMTVEQARQVAAGLLRVADEMEAAQS